MEGATASTRRACRSRCRLRRSPDLRRLLTAEIFIRWGDWFARLRRLYVVSLSLEPRPGARVPRQRRQECCSPSWLTALLTSIGGGQMGGSIGLAPAIYGDLSVVLALPDLPRGAAAGSLWDLACQSWRTGRRLCIERVAGMANQPASRSSRPAKSARAEWAFIGGCARLRSFRADRRGVAWRQIGPEATFLLGGLIGLAERL